MTPVLSLPRIGDLRDRDTLERLVGPIRELRRSAMITPGFSSALFERFVVGLEDGEEAGLVLKRVGLGGDWIMRRSGDTVGREARLLATPDLEAVWDVFACPYLAYAVSDGEIGLLMHDLSPWLLPDAREPIALAAEEALLERLARLHARCWEAPFLDQPWLAAPHHLLSVIGPHAAREERRLGPLPPVLERAERGWDVALGWLPSDLAALVSVPAAEIARRCDDLPRTLVHGDAKVANFAFLPGGRVAAFDWAVAAAAPATFDLGWYLAVNASRLARTRDALIERYRVLLERELGRALDARLWARLRDTAVLCGALMLLWSKALNREAGLPGAAEEWEWWMSGLARLER